MVFPKRIERLIIDLENEGYETDCLFKLPPDKKRNGWWQYEDVFKSGPPERQFVDVVHWLSFKVGPFCQLESRVSPNEGVFDVQLTEFLIEVSTLLKEMKCPITWLIEDLIAGGLESLDSKVCLISYLCSELQAAKILALRELRKPERKIQLPDSKTAKELKETLIALKFRKPPKTITTQQLFTELQKKLKMLCGEKTPKDIVGDLLFSGSLTEKQWFQLENLCGEFYKEYKTRRSLLLTRLDVTIQSFFWADRLKDKAEETMNVYNKKKSQISVDPSVTISDILAVTSDLATIEKTSSASVRKNTKSAVNRVIIGTVPDRGGRPEEQQPPPPEVPSWQKRDSSRGGMQQSYQQSNANVSQNRSSRPNYFESQQQRESSNQGYNQNYSRGNYRGNQERTNQNTYRGDGAPVYRPVNPPFGGFGGFGGYTLGPAGDNFQQYGMSDASNTYAPRGAYGSGPRPRGGFSDRGNQFCGRSRGRGRY